MKLNFSIYRYNPDVDDAPHMKGYQLDVPDGSDMMVSSRTNAVGPWRRKYACVRYHASYWLSLWRA